MVEFHYRNNNLTGRWNCDDGGTYFLNEFQLASEPDINRMCWAGFGPSDSFTNMFMGVVKDYSLSPNTQIISGEWADVPLGKARSFGKLTLRNNEDHTKLYKIQNTGGFGGTEWTKFQITFPPVIILGLTDRVAHSVWQGDDGGKYYLSWETNDGPWNESALFVRGIGMVGISSICVLDTLRNASTPGQLHGYWAEVTNSNNSYLGAAKIKFHKVSDSKLIRTEFFGTGNAPNELTLIENR